MFAVHGETREKEWDFALGKRISFHLHFCQFSQHFCKLHLCTYIIISASVFFYFYTTGIKCFPVAPFLINYFLVVTYYITYLQVLLTELIKTVIGVGKGRKGLGNKGGTVDINYLFSLSNRLNGQYFMETYAQRFSFDWLWFQAFHSLANESIRRIRLCCVSISFPLLIAHCPNLAYGFATLAAQKHQRVRKVRA